MKKVFTSIMLCCALLCAVTANAQDASFDLWINSVTSPQSGMQTSQPVTINVRNTKGTDPVPSLRVGVIKNGTLLFEEQVDTVVGKGWTTPIVQITLKNKVDFEWGAKDTLKIYAKGNGGVDTDEKNDTATQYVNMPVLRSFPYTWNSSTSPADFTSNQFKYDETRGVFYYTSSAYFRNTNAVVTPVIPQFRNL